MAPPRGVLWAGTALLLAHAALRAAAETKMGPVLFLNFLRRDLELRWQNPAGGSVSMSQVPAMGDARVGTTFTGHVFRLVGPGAAGGEEDVAAEFRMEPGRSSYVLGPAPDDAEALKHPRYLQHMEEQEVLRYERALHRLHGQGELQAVRFMHPVASQDKDVGMGVVFKNFRRWPLVLFWDDASSPGVYNGEVPSMGETASITSFPGHAFKIMRQTEAGKYELVRRVVMDRTVRTYVVEPDPEDASHPSYLKHLGIMRHNADYLERTGIEWLGAQPPDPPSLPMYAPASELGEVAHVVKVRGRRTQGGEADHRTLEIKALTWRPHGPRLFLLEGLLDREECEHVAGLAEDKLGDGKVGGSKGFSSKTRTSKVAFLSRDLSPELEAIHEKFADALNVSDAELRASAEHLQVVRYKKSQEYSSHYDYEGSTDLNRLATLLVYLEPADDGGGTSFPRAFGNRGLEVRPKQGDAILFYSQLPDGNLDELSLHAGLPVHSGVKRVCNLWMHSHGDHRGWQVSQGKPSKGAEL